jgi:hypothetical protein
VFVKAFTFKQTNADGNQNNDLALSSLVFALTAEETRVLQMEPVLQEGHCHDPNWGCWWCTCHIGRAV